jgi:hypothetical protein
MEREFIGKDVEVLVSFAGSFRDAGYAPLNFMENCSIRTKTT